MKLVLSYPLKQFLATILIGSLLIVLHVNEPADRNFDFSHLPGEYLLFLMFSCLFSLPTFGVYFLVFRFLISKSTPAVITKAILNCVAILGLITTMLIITGSLAIPIIISYSIAIIVSSLFLKYRK